MPPAVVQSGFAIGSPFTFGVNNTLHNAILAALSTTDVLATSLELSDTQGNIYSSLPFRLNKTVAASLSSQIFYCLDINAGANILSGQAFDFNHGPLGATDLIVCEVTLIKFLEIHANAIGIGLAQDSGSIAVRATESFLLGHEAGKDQASLTADATFTEIAHISSGQLQFKVVGPGTYNSTTTTTVGKGGTCFWLEDIASFTQTLPPPASGGSNIITF
jgi:hypothetical protein